MVQETSCVNTCHCTSWEQRLDKTNWGGPIFWLKSYPQWISWMIFAPPDMFYIPFSLVSNLDISNCKKHQQHVPLRSTRQITVLQDVRGSKKDVLSFHQAALASDKQQERWFDSDFYQVKMDMTWSNCLILINTPIVWDPETNRSSTTPRNQDSCGGYHDRGMAVKTASVNPGGSPLDPRLLIMGSVPFSANYSRDPSKKFNRVGL